MKQKFIHEVVSDCLDIIKIFKDFPYPKQMRVVLIGPRGSGRNTQAKLIAKKLNLVHSTDTVVSIRDTCL